MPPKKRVTLPDHVRAAVLADVALSHKTAQDADENSKIRLYLATEQGLDTYELAEELGISQTSVSKYARLGREALERRKREREARESARDQQPGEDPLRPGELESIG